MKRKEEITHQDILEAVNKFATSVDKRFDGVDKRFDGVDKRFDGLESRVTKIEATMVTKDYLDDKLGDLKGDIVILMRKEDRKLQYLIDILHKRKVISDQEVKQILSMQPFPQLLK